MNPLPLPFSEKYRPKTLKDFGFPLDMTETLESFLVLDRLALLFVGDSGSGKTALLNTLVHTYYSPYTYHEFVNNILFINNLKDQGFSFYRNEMKSFCQSRSIFANRKKMVILDDIDLINKQNQHVFRNYIDKYGAHVHFLLVCGNLQRVIESLQSRTFILRLPIATLEHRRRILEHICSEERLALTNDAKEYVLHLSDNIAGSSVRNVVNFLEKIWLLLGASSAVAANTTQTQLQRGNSASAAQEPYSIAPLSQNHLPQRMITLEMCRQICSAIPLERYESYLTLLCNGNLKEAIAILYEIYDYGYSVIDILDYFFTFVKYSPQLPEDVKYKMIRVLCEYISVYHNIHEHPIELALFTGELSPILVVDNSSTKA
jgi:DNA polymerase III delta prime subunit